jgi:hypothetical protein
MSPAFKYFIISILLRATFCCGQINRDLLLNVLLDLNSKTSSYKIDTAKISVLIELAWQYGNNNPDSCVLLANQALIFSEKIILRLVNSKRANYK